MQVPPNLDRAALEALVLQNLRANTLSEVEARQILGIPSRYEMDGFLKSHGLLHPITLEQVLEDAATASRFRRV